MQLTQAILPVASLGTRFLPWTKVVPKELLPIGNVPIIALLVDECLSIGIRDICFVISRGKEKIPEYFYPDPTLETILAEKGKVGQLAQLRKYNEVNFHVVYQDRQLGDGHAVLQAAPWVKSETIAVLFGDDLIAGKENGLTQLTKAYGTIADAGSALLCLENIDRELSNQYGVVKIDEEKSSGRLKKITGLVEKPAPQDAPSTLGIVGKYIIPKSTIDLLPEVKHGEGGEIRLIDALIAQVNDIAIYGYEFEGQRLDTGRPEGYKEAVRVLG